MCWKNSSFVDDKLPRCYSTSIVNSEGGCFGGIVFGGVVLVFSWGFFVLFFLFFTCLAAVMTAFVGMNVLDLELRPIVAIARKLYVHGNTMLICSFKD